MKIDNKLIDHLAVLSKLEFEQNAKEEIKNNLQKILDLVEKLNELDTDGVEPLVYMTDNQNILREDVVIANTTREDALKNAPDKDSDYIKVPKVISK
jgi:aspartyl-tRNA(Asn)/glutamyl-tRNA(Gln) amidotransferase subunit C